MKSSSLFLRQRKKNEELGGDELGPQLMASRARMASLQEDMTSVQARINEATGERNA